MSRLRWVSAALPAILATACTSVPGMPNAGTGSKFNLATVEYVDSRESAIADRVKQQVTSELPAILDEAIKDERARLAAIETALVAQQSQMAELMDRMQVTQEHVALLSEEVRLRVADLENSNVELRTMAGALSTEVDALPADTLRELSAALTAHLGVNALQASAPAVTPTANPAVSASATPDVAAGPDSVPAWDAAAEPVTSEFVDTPEVPAP